MAQKAQKRGKYTLKTFDSNLYTWSPEANVKKRATSLLNQQVTNNFCNATANSQGQDWTVNYVYNISVVNGIIERSAYVACGYIE
jgi:hypothetical protein